MLILGIGSFMVLTLSAMFVGICVFMMLVILIQKPKGGGLTGAFGGAGGAVQTAFGSKVGDLLTWVTVVCFVIFLLLAMGLTWQIQADLPAIKPRTPKTAAAAAAPVIPPLPAAETPVTPRPTRHRAGGLALIRSMTGFGDVSEQIDGVHYSVEIRSLNNRFFKAVIRLPDSIAGLEAELEQRLRQRLARGSITLSVNVRDSGASAAHCVNDAALLTYLDHLENIHARFAGKQRNINIDLTALLNLPGVLEPADKESMVKRARAVVMRMVDQACDRLIAMRETEGQTTARDLSRQREVMRERLSEIARRAPLVIEEYHQRLKARIDQLLARAQLAMEHKDLIREVAIFAERADIAEELSRLAAHLEQFEKLAADDNQEPAGRTLEFICQEMLREANTIASKSNDAVISRAIVEVKGAIDRIKEQTQNVE